MTKVILFLNSSGFVFDDLQLAKKQTTKGPKKDPPRRLSGDFRIHKLEKIVGGA
jgi:hypothetical protein